MRSRNLPPHLLIIFTMVANVARSKEQFAGKEIIITTYGTLRSDIKMMVDIPFDYVVLDESQAIKNPSSKVTGLQDYCVQRIVYA